MHIETIYIVSCKFLVFLFSFFFFFPHNILVSILEPCSKCGKLLSMDKQLGVVLPPVKRPYRHFTAGRNSSKSSSLESYSLDLVQAFHISCFSDDA